MRYLVTLHGDESLDPEPGTPEFDALMAAYDRFDKQAASAIVGGEALQPSAAAVTVRPGAGEPLVTGGPFAETAEVVGGFYVLEAETLDDGIELARQIPAASTGVVELRPVVEYFDMGPRGTEPGEGRDRYLALIYGKETPADVPGTPEWEQGAAEHKQFVDGAGSDVRSGAAVHPAATTTTVRVRDGEVVLTDGPFTETAEVIGGLYTFGPVTRDRAVELAARIPINPGGAISLQPIWELG
jgi:hypothetical protein